MTRKVTFGGRSASISILLGGGIPAFRPMGRRVELELVEARAMARGCVLLRYSAAQ